jgi:mono/diheme cytochrome c family protein
MVLGALVLAIALLALTGCQPRVAVRSSLTQIDEVAVTEVGTIVPVEPSAEEGRRVFELQCWTCHGYEGVGDGPLARGLKAPHKNPFTDTMRLLGLEVREEDLPSRPANFHNTVQMRLNSPASMYETVTLGRAHTAMPAFGPRPAYGANDGMPGPRFLPDEQRWHVIFYEWTFATSPESIARGRELYERPMPVEVEGLGRIQASCADCHGPQGDGQGGRFSQAIGRRIWGWNLRRGVGIFTDRDFMVKRKPTELYARISDGRSLMPGYKQRLSEDEIWSLVDYLWTFVYKYTPARGQQP